MTSMEKLMRTVCRQAAKVAEDTSGGTATGNLQPEMLMRRMETPSCSGKVTGWCGETMEIYLDVEGERVVDASFFTDGCGFSRLCGAMVALLARGKTLDEAAEIEGDTVLGLLKGIPDKETHCAFLAAETLHAAIHDWMVK